MYVSNCCGAGIKPDDGQGPQITCNKCNQPCEPIESILYKEFIDPLLKEMASWLILRMLKSDVNNFIVIMKPEIQHVMERLIIAAEVRQDLVNKGHKVKSW